MGQGIKRCPFFNKLGTCANKFPLMSNLTIHLKSHVSCPINLLLINKLSFRSKSDPSYVPYETMISNTNPISSHIPMFMLKTKRTIFVSFLPANVHSRDGARCKITMSHVILKKLTKSANFLDAIGLIRGNQIWQFICDFTVVLSPSLVLSVLNHSHQKETSRNIKRCTHNGQVSYEL